MAEEEGRASRAPSSLGRLPSSGHLSQKTEPSFFKKSSLLSFHYNQGQILVERMAKSKDGPSNFEGNEISDPPTGIVLEKVKISCPGLAMATAPPSWPTRQSPTQPVELSCRSSVARRPPREARSRPATPSVFWALMAGEPRL